MPSGKTTAKLVGVSGRCSHYSWKLTASIHSIGFVGGCGRCPCAYRWCRS
jgi:hypothetical protein